MTQIRFHPDAETELRESAAFYEARIPGLGLEFIAEIEDVCSILGEHPALGAYYDLEHRRALLRRFPFALIYRHLNDSIIIVAVAHTKRRPGYWRDRT